MLLANDPGRYAPLHAKTITDDRLLRYATDKIKIVNPVQFITEEE